ncbi:unnamed protein product [Polarella glacialis]|uniref:Uncharacterized protein n=1 Tax=Polarella glacialis TaxID=89957 RepID=A0A813IWE9_POLGL|nr:unnamed protein product [Polarella glacialis]CAE8656550.1 unnamed protein product [Polarella glacialis]CAE8728071.1 unnamed protein product [Polarella glacialis]
MSPFFSVGLILQMRVIPLCLGGGGVWSLPTDLEICKEDTNQTSYLQLLSHSARSLGSRRRTTAEQQQQSNNRTTEQQHNNDRKATEQQQRLLPTNNSASYSFYDIAADVFAEEEEQQLRFLERSNTYHQTSQPRDIVFLKDNFLGSASARADEASTICAGLGYGAISVFCSSFCEMSSNTNNNTNNTNNTNNNTDNNSNTNNQTKLLFVHVKDPCECALQRPGKHVFDPIDNPLSYDSMVKASASKYWDGVLVGTSAMVSEVSKHAAALQSSTKAFLLPHHHSNFHARRHSKSSKEQVVIGLIGDDSDELTGPLTTCMSNLGADNFTVKTLSQVPVEILNLLGPSVRGDFFATKLSSFDIGIVWTQKTVGPDMWERKPPQRLVNALSVGIPVVAYAGYAGHQDVAALGHKFMQLAASSDELCTVLVQLIQDHSSTNTTAGIHIAEAYYSPMHIGKLYISLLRELSQI